jgi:hypothetical protein
MPRQQRLARCISGAAERLPFLKLTFSCSTCNCVIRPNFAMQSTHQTSTESALAGASTPFRAVSALLFVTALVAGCNQPVQWDREYACTGQEQSISSFAGDDQAMANRKTYPQTIDFHLRLPGALVKSRRVSVDSTTDGVVSFSAREPTAWMAGHFHPQTGELDVIDEKVLQIAGRDQQIRTSGQYSCQASGSARLA